MDVQVLPSGAVQASVDGKPFGGEVVRVPGGVVLRVDGASIDVAVGAGSGDVMVASAQVRTVAKVESTRERARSRKRAGADSAEDALRAPMPGRIVKILVAEGEEVSGGQPLIIMEAMKMENELRAAAPVRVAKIEVSEGANVEADALLIRYESSSA